MRSRASGGEGPGAAQVGYVGGNSYPLGSREVRGGLHQVSVDRAALEIHCHRPAGAGADASDGLRPVEGNLRRRAAQLEPQAAGVIGGVVNAGTCGVVCLK